MDSSGLPSRIITSARLPSSICADFLVNTHHARRHDRRGLNRFHGRESGLDVQLDLAVQTVPWNRLVRSGHDGDSSLMQRANNRKFFHKDFFGELRVG